MEKRNDFLPARPEDIKRDLPQIIDRVATLLSMLPEELRRLPEVYDYDSYVTHGEQLIENHIRHGEQTGLALGALLMVIKGMSGESKWYETLGRLGIAPRTASRYMLNYRNFGDAPELVEGLGSAKLELLGKLPEEYRDELKETGRMIMPDGSEIHLTAFKQMVLREMNNEIVKIRNEKNAKIRDLEDSNLSLKRELKDAIEQYEYDKAYLEKLMKDKDPAMAERIDALKKQLTDKEQIIIDLRAEMEAGKKAECSEGEVIEAIAEARKAVDRVIDSFNNMTDDHLPGSGARARAELSGFIGYLHKFTPMLAIREAGIEE